MADFHFKNKWLALLLTLFLILSPRIFAHSFYNAKDLIFLPLFIITSYYLILFLDHMTWRSAIPFALATAFLISMRVLGVIVPVLAIGFVVLSWLIPNWRVHQFKQSIIPLSTYLITSVLFTIAIWPFLWEAPFEHFAFVFKSLSKYNWGGDNLYFNHFIKATEVPWHYSLGWIFISTPLLYTLLFLVGFIYVLVRLPKSVFWRRMYAHELEAEHRRLVFLSLFLTPILAVIVFKSTLYDAWRQLFFVYPAFLILAGEGLQYLTNLSRTDTKRAALRTKLHAGRGTDEGGREVIKKQKAAEVLQYLGLGIIGISVLSTTFFMIKYHPHQNVYFNRAAGTSLDTRFDQDYWGLANKQVLEQLLEKDTSSAVKVHAANWAAIANRDILPLAQRKRLKYVSYEEADYYISNHRDWRDYYRMKDNQPPFDQPVVEIKVRGNIICGAYRAEGKLEKYPK